MLTREEADASSMLSSPLFWIAGAVALILILVFGFGSRLAELAWGPDPAEIRAQCVEDAKYNEERCRNGGVGAVFKTSKRIATCHEIYREEVAYCGQ